MAQPKLSTAKPMASLSSGLLARKGQARPAMRPQGFHGYGAAGSIDDLGWNDMGEVKPAPVIQAPTEPVPLPPVLIERAELEREIEAPAAAVSAVRAARSAPQTGTRHAKAAFTLRLDADRHLRLRLASALANRSAQRLVTEALDAFLQTLPEVDELARQLPAAAHR